MVVHACQDVWQQSAEAHGQTLVGAEPDHVGWLPVDPAGLGILEETDAVEVRIPLVVAHMVM